MKSANKFILKMGGELTKWTWPIKPNSFNVEEKNNEQNEKGGSMFNTPWIYIYLLYCSLIDE
jgi:hypothetical protein